MDEQEIDRLARKRVAMNAGNPTNNYFAEELKVHTAGVRGEAAFADEYGLGYEQIRAGRGSDGGFDFKIHFDGWPLTIDVKTRDLEPGDTQNDLLVPAVKFELGNCADLFVLARCTDKKIRLLGWEHPVIVKCMPASVMRVLTHMRPVSEMRPMSQLTNVMRLRDRLPGAA